MMSIGFYSNSASAKQTVDLPTNVISTHEILKQDGTLSLDGGFAGALDPRGWDIHLDPQHGPVFINKDRNWSAPFALSGSWAGLGDNGSGNGALAPLGTVCAIAVNGTNVYVGGSFTDVNNHGTVLTAADYIAKWDGTNWSALGNNGSGDGAIPHMLGNCQVNSIVVNGNDVFIGGLFTEINNHGHVLSEAKYVARWDGTNWSALGNGGAGQGSIGCCSVSSIATDGSNLYVGGNFSNVNNYGTSLTAADGIAMWDGANWSALGSDGAGDGSLGCWVDDIAVSGNDLFVAGCFKDVNNHGVTLTAADYVAKWDCANWSALGSNGSGDGSFKFGSVVDSIVVNSGNVYVAGAFTDVDNAGTVLAAADYVAKWDGANWSALGSDGAGSGSLNNKVNAIAVSGNNVYVGGLFLDVNNAGTVLTAADRIAKWDGTNWSALSSNGAGDGSLLGPNVGALAMSGSGLYVGGYFLNINDNGTLLTNADNIALYSLPSDFSDVATSYWAWQYVERLYHAGITGGCSTSPLMYCPENQVTRAQMAVFLEKGVHYPSTFTPTNVIPTFSDIIGHWAEDWIEALRSGGITGGCGTNLYCPENPVTRAQMAVFLLKSKYGSGYTPPAVEASTGFSDVPVTHWAAPWIKQLAAESITGGCGAGIYCPDSPVTRAQMAVFLVKTFNLP